MLKKIIRNTLRDAHNLFGWTTNRKIVVFESDDWGSIRVPSKEVYDLFKLSGFPVENSDYNRLDTLESKNDLEFLFEVLASYKNSHGHHPIFTPNVIVANPDFRKIEASGFATYFYESLPETFQRYYPKEDVFAVYRQGMDQNLFHPQFHGREHLNIHRWMKRLQERDEDTLFSFQHRSTYSGKSDYSFMEAFDFDSADVIDFQKEVIRDGLNLFEQLFGYRSKSFIPPCYVWDSKIENALKEYRKNSDSVNLFLEDGQYIKSIESIISLKALYASYKDFCKDSGYQICSLKSFSERLKTNNGYVIERKANGRVVYITKTI